MLLAKPKRSSGEPQGRLSPGAHEGNCRPGSDPAPVPAQREEMWQEGRQQAADYMQWARAQGDPWKKLPRGGQHHYPRVLMEAWPLLGQQTQRRQRAKQKQLKKQKGPGRGNEA